MNDKSDEIISRMVCTLPTAKKYRTTQFSTVKKRTGAESVRFLDLDSGTRKVRFINEKGREVILTVKTWLSPYGWAWKIIK